MSLIAEKGIAIVVDVRRTPHSRWTQWSRAYLRRVFGKRYRWIKALGNLSRREGEIHLVDEEKGLAELQRLLVEHGSVLLLCVEVDPRRCHRSYIVDRMKERLPDLEVEHLGVEVKR